MPPCHGLSQQLLSLLPLPHRYRDAQGKARAEWLLPAQPCPAWHLWPALPCPRQALTARPVPPLKELILPSAISHFHFPPLAPIKFNCFNLITPEIHLAKSFLQYIDWIYIIVISFSGGFDIVSQPGQLSYRLLSTVRSKSIQSSWNTLEIISLQFSAI